MVLTFEEYMAKRILTEEGHNFTNREIKMLVEAGFMDRVKKWGKNAALAGAMGAAGMGAMGTGQQAQQAPNPQPYNYTYSNMVGDQQAQQDYQKDMDWHQQNGFNTHMDQDWSSPPDLSKMSPSDRSQFVHGTEMSAVDELSEMHASVIQGEIQKHMGRECFVSIIQSKDLGTGGVSIVAEITGTIMAMNEQDAQQRVQTVVQQIMKSKGYDIQDMQSLGGGGADIGLSQAPRSTIDYVPESQGQPVPFKIRVTFVAPKGS